jgi:hypothetical protein
MSDAAVEPPHGIEPPHHRRQQQSGDGVLTMKQALEYVRWVGQSIGKLSIEVEEQECDRDIMMIALGLNGQTLQVASTAMQDDQAVVLQAVHSDGWALQWASEQLKDDILVVGEAVNSRGRALHCAGEQWLKDDILVWASPRLKALGREGVQKQWAVANDLRKHAKREQLAAAATEALRKQQAEVIERNRRPTSPTGASVKTNDKNRGRRQVRDVEDRCRWS